MAINSIGVMSPGDMGSGVGGVLAENGFDVWTALEGRSDSSKERAEQQGIKDAGSLDDLVKKCDLILSIMVPSHSLKNSLHP
jgi:3-hydroxyisobutyrate dehydrogenase-like beta-hydroxyacid dehydrogenase